MPVDRIMRVPYNLPGSRSWQWVNIFTRMSQERILFLNQPLTDGVANSLVSALLYLDSEDQSKPIYLYINSIGDPVMSGQADESAGMISIRAGLAVYDTIAHIKSEVLTICMGTAYGMAAVLLAAGVKGKRAALPHTSIALTHPTTLTRGQATDINLEATEVLAKRKLIQQILANSTGQSAEKIAKDMERMFYLSPAEAKDYGLIDRVIENPALASSSVPALSEA
ncbi:ATP-dependent Clp protease proteolytic subunit [cf. Phormidesmis sp. LEGE 11477]|uniref:ATP-dependent Clp protease proteolytic subunit n=1 Tax=cf. Phormidesmis sp. LEGE 11477 TaxID=1828680 RepID=UPI00187EB81B|nr:ATP-dependent Clp protease proteolytic subunit [cf. Phormidesmis sp. LEGE 11477]MBE9061508.1 ATP-dependent Clp protease proteolytic subunit [cf. Phormidesmis sp. LEGE 11477]